MKNKLIKLANHLDSKGLMKEADYLDAIIRRAHGWDDSDGGEDESPEEKVAELEARVNQLEKELEGMKSENYQGWYDEQDVHTQDEHDRHMHQQDKMNIMSDFHSNEMDID